MNLSTISSYNIPYLYTYMHTSELLVCLALYLKCSPKRRKFFILSILLKIKNKNNAATICNYSYKLDFIMTSPPDKGKHKNNQM